MFQRILFQISVVNAVHIVEVLILSDHTPDKGICSGTASGMDGPAGGDHCFFVTHYDVAGLIGLTHIVHNKGILRHIEIQIYFHTSVMCMTRHGVPYTAGL